MSPTVATVRARLSPEQNARYPDYQIERWLKHKKDSVEEAVQTIQRQQINDDRLKAILTEPERRQATLTELNRQVLNVIHHPEQHQVIVYVNTRNQASYFVEQEAADALLAFMHYLFARIEQLEGPDRQAILIIDMMHATTPRLEELQAQMRMYSGILGRSFPLIYSQVLLCCSWNLLLRKTISAVARVLDVTFITPAELLNRFGPAFVPTIIGGFYNLEDGPPIGDLVMEFLQINPGKSVAGSPGPPPIAAGDGGRWAWVTARPLQLSSAAATAVAPAAPGHPRLLLPGTLLFAALCGEYLTALLCAAWVAVLYFFPQEGPVTNHRGQGKVLARFLDAQYEYCQLLLQPVEEYIALKEIGSQDVAVIRLFILAMCVTLTPTRKSQLKRCLAAVLECCQEAHELYGEAAAPFHKWQGLYSFLSIATKVKVRCCCGCCELGDLDWLDGHLAPRSTPHSVATYELRRECALLGVTPPGATTVDVPAVSPLSPKTRAVLSLPSAGPPPIALDASRESPRFTGSQGAASPHRPTSAHKHLMSEIHSVLRRSPLGHHSRTNSREGAEGDSESADGGCDACGCRFGLTHRRCVCRDCNASICSGCAAVWPSKLSVSSAACQCKRCAGGGLSPASPDALAARRARGRPLSPADRPFSR